MKLDFLTWFVSVFACYRATVLVARDLGPFNVFRKLREKSRMLKCPYCVSLYIGSVAAFALWMSGFVEPLAVWFALSLSFSACSVILDRCFTVDYLPK